MESFASQELRFLVTQSCNYRCVFCHGEGLQSRKKSVLSPSDYAFMFAVGQKYFGMDSTTLTGGEPLVRRDIVQIASEIRQAGSNEITLVTNGNLLKKKMAIGDFVTRVNISLHSLRQGTYESIVQRKGSYGVAIDGLKAFRQAFPVVDVCINFTVAKGLNYSEEEVLEVVEFAESLGIALKFIELFPSSLEGFVSLTEIQSTLCAHGFEVAMCEGRKIILSNGRVPVALTKIFCAIAESSPDPQGYCRHNNDLFISPDGKIKPCRNSAVEVDAKGFIKSRNEEGLCEAIRHSLSLLGHGCKNHSVAP